MGGWTGPRPPTGPPQDSLSGVWDVTLRATGGMHVTKGQEIPARIALLRSTTASRLRWSDEGGATHVGVIDRYLRIGVESSPRSHLPTLVGASEDAGGRITVVVNPGPSHGSLVMEGRAAGDSVSGRWYVTAYAMGATGTFVMRKAAP